MSTVLHLTDITRQFTQGSKTLDVLNGVSLSLGSKELVALVGSSGSGKSTLLQIAGLLDKPSSGSIEIDGRRIDDLDDQSRTNVRRDQLGFVYQFHHLLPDFSALENVMLAGRIQGDGPRDAKEEARELMTELGLADRLDHVPSRLSGGEQQRVAIARGLMGSPKVLLADEPTGNLDSETSKRVFDHMMNAVSKRDMSALIVTHDQSLAAQSDRSLLLRQGKVVASSGEGHA